MKVVLPEVNIEKKLKGKGDSKHINKKKKFNDSKKASVEKEKRKNFEKFFINLFNNILVFEKQLKNSEKENIFYKNKSLQFYNLNNKNNKLKNVKVNRFLRKEILDINSNKNNIKKQLKIKINNSDSKNLNNSKQFDVKFNSENKLSDLNIKNKVNLKGLNLTDTNTENKKNKKEYKFTKENGFRKEINDKQKSVLNRLKTNINKKNNENEFYNKDKNFSSNDSKTKFNNSIRNKLLNQKEKENNSSIKGDSEFSKDVINNSQLNNFIKMNNLTKFDSLFKPGTEFLKNFTYSLLNEIQKMYNLYPADLQTIMSNMILNHFNGNYYLSLRLYPESLGKIDIFLKKEDGKLTGRLIVESSEVKKLLEQKFDLLRENLIDHSINFDNLSIMLENEFNSNGFFPENDNNNFNNIEDKLFLNSLKRKFNLNEAKNKNDYFQSLKLTDLNIGSIVNQKV